MARVRCVSCREWTDARWLHEDARFAQCLECGTLCDDPERIDREGTPEPEPAADASPPPWPEGVDVREVEGVVPGDEGKRPILQITGPAPRRRPASVAFELIAIVVVAPLVVAGLFKAGQPGLGLLAIVPGLAVFVFAYVTRVPDASRPTVAMGDQVLGVGRVPFPWRKRYVARRFVMHLTVRQSHDLEGATPTFEIVAILRSGERWVLLDGLTSAPEAMRLGARMAERWG